MAVVHGRTRSSKSAPPGQCPASGDVQENLDGHPMSHKAESAAPTWKDSSKALEKLKPKRLTQSPAKEFDNRPIRMNNARAATPEARAGSLNRGRAAAAPHAGRTAAPGRHPLAAFARPARGPDGTRCSRPRSRPFPNTRLLICRLASGGWCPHGLAPPPPDQAREFAVSLRGRAASPGPRSKTHGHGHPSPTTTALPRPKRRQHRQKPGRVLGMAMVTKRWSASLLKAHGEKGCCLD